MVSNASDSSSLEPFSRDRLFLSIYKSCEHRTSALEDATGLTQIVIGNILRDSKEARISGATLARITATALQRFDIAAADVYNAYHPRARKTVS